MRAEQALARVSTPSPREILTVSALIRSVRDLIEHRYPLLWVAGEISNFTTAKSGHAYFVLKDEHAQARCVMFRHRHRGLEWLPRDGLQVEAQVLVTMYEPRGDFQLNVETMRRAGRGALFEAFLRLRERLEKEGLFETEKKRQLPPFPRTIGVVTSREAAALRDVLTTIERRDPSVAVVLFPVRVQGAGAAEEIAARAVRACPIPVVTGIGHETDFTIADFAADRRAPTPTAAAEMVSPERTQLLHVISRLAARIGLRARHELEGRMLHVDHLARRLVHPGARLQAQGELLGQLWLRLGHALARVVAERQWRIAALLQRSRARLPNLDELSARWVQAISRVRAETRARVERAAADCARLAASLAHLDPAAVLERGYSIVHKLDGGIVRDSAALAVGESVALRFAKGSARARIAAKD